jgi:hypothetical protein
MDLMYLKIKTLNSDKFAFMELLGGTLSRIRGMESVFLSF